MKGGMKHMRRGTTPMNIVHTDLDLNTAEAVYLTYAQKKNTVIEKELSNMDVTVKVQIRVRKATFSTDEDLRLKFSTDEDIYLVRRTAESSVTKD